MFTHALPLQSLLGLADPLTHCYLGFSRISFVNILGGCPASFVYGYDGRAGLME